MTLTQRLTEILDKEIVILEISKDEINKRIQDKNIDKMCWFNVFGRFYKIDSTVALTAIITAIRTDVEGLRKQGIDWQDGKPSPTDCGKLKYNQAIDDVLEKLK